MPEAKYYEANRDKCLEYQKEYYKEHKHDINQKRYVKIECNICGACYLKSNKMQHIKSKKHKSVEKIINDLLNSRHEKKTLEITDL